MIKKKQKPELFYDHIFERVPVGFFRLSPEGNILLTNEYLAEMLGYESSKELIGLARELVIDRGIKIPEIDQLEKMVMNQKTLVLEEQIMTGRNGEKLITNISVWISKDPGSDTLSIEGSIINITEEIEYREKLNSRTEIMSSISDASEAFLEATDLEISIQKALGQLGRATGANRAFIFENHWGVTDELHMRLSYDWAYDIESLLEKYDEMDMSYAESGLDFWMENFSQNQIIQGHVKDFHFSAKKTLERDRVKSILLAPINVEQDWWGFIGIETVFEEKKWDKLEIDAIQVAASVFGSALQRQKMEKELKESKDLFRMVADFTLDWEFWVNTKGEFVYSSPSFKEITGYSFLYQDQDISIFDKIIHPDDLIRVKGQIENQISFPVSASFEYRILTQSQEIRWMEHVSRPVYSDNGSFLGQRASVRDITKRRKAEIELKDVNESLNNYVDKLEQMNSSVMLMNEMGVVMQSCVVRDDVFAVLSEFSSQLFPDQSGALYMLDDRDKKLNLAVQFGETINSDSEFSIDACWALRRGTPHLVLPGKTQLACSHVDDGDIGEATPAYFCVPLSFEGKTLGLLYLENIPEVEGQNVRQLAQTVAERTAISIANLDLREQLRLQTIVDPLTGLFNRRFMEDMLTREHRRAVRSNSQYAVVMLDIDNFKGYNDNFGHDAGDVLLQALGNYLKTRIREEDIPCRYGGDEFTLILPCPEICSVLERLDDLRKGVHNIQVHYQDRVLESITISVGAATYPAQGADPKTILQMADKALYMAKEQGKNKVVLLD